MAALSEVIVASQDANVAAADKAPRPSIFLETNCPFNWMLFIKAKQHLSNAQLGFPDDEQIVWVSQDFHSSTLDSVQSHRA